MRTVVAVFAAAGLAFAHGAIAAEAAETLAKNNGCFACHAIDKKLVGPGYKEIQAKYRNDKAAEAKLFKKVKEGGKGVWGDVPMPPNTHVKDADIKTMVQWILNMK